MNPIIRYNNNLFFKTNIAILDLMVKIFFVFLFFNIISISLIQAQDHSDIEISIPPFLNPLDILDLKKMEVIIESKKIDCGNFDDDDVKGFSECSASLPERTKKLTVEKTVDIFIKAITEKVHERMLKNSDIGDIKSSVNGIIVGKADITEGWDKKEINYECEIKAVIEVSISEKLRKSLVEECDTEYAQMVLNRLDLYHGIIDGEYGTKTTNAVTKFQKAQAIDTTVKIDNETCRKLIKLNDKLGYKHEEPITGMEFVFIPGGTFCMGSQDEGLIENVYVDSFYIGKYEVTNAQFKKFIEDSDEATSSGDDNKPVINVSWKDAVNFANWLSCKSGKIFRLPSEAEWEYVCKYADEYHLSTTVEISQPNAGICDMLGSVWEWVDDTYNSSKRCDSYDDSIDKIINPRCAGEEKDLRVMRGGWDDQLKHVRCCYRWFYPPEIGLPQTGFRLVLEQPLKRGKKSDECKKRKPVKAGFVYASPVGDGGWTFSHEIGRKNLENLSFVHETDYIELIPGKNSEVVHAVKELIDRGFNLIFTTIPGMEQIHNVAEQNKDIIFMNYSGKGDKALPNVGSYSGRMYEPRYLTGMIAGSMTKSNIIGYVAAFEVPEVIRGINAFTLGARSIKEDVTVWVAWTNKWYDPDAERLAAEKLLDKGAEILTMHQNSPTVVQAVEKKGKFVIGYHSDMARFAPKTHLTAPIWNWTAFYEDVAERVYDGTWNPGQFWLDMNTDMITLASISDNISIEIKDKVDIKKKEIIDGEFHVFQGPIIANDNTLKVRGKRIMTDSEILQMDFFVEGVTDLD
ncbi:MAG: BMP family ABC transporter substrate-binding protein [Desulfobacterales bacterium]|nr:BMP family ABC transporter substrate-binding protein [Desulfobacterales bacterium]